MNDDFMTQGDLPRASPLMPIVSGLWSGFCSWAVITSAAHATTRAAAM